MRFSLVTFAVALVWMQPGARGQQKIYGFQLPGQTISVAICAGDVNGDGFDDVVMTNAASGGSATFYVYSGRTGEELLTWFIPAHPFAQYAVSWGGDVNGDGKDDVVVGDRGATPPSGGLQTGSVTVRSGLDGSIIWRRFGGPPDGLGDDVAGLGDINGDGYADVAGLSASRYVVVYSGFDGSIIHLIPPAVGTLEQPGRVAKAGDVNFDGVPDILVGGTDPSRASTQGFVHVHSGVDGSLIRSWGQPGPWTNFGYWIDGGKDVDNDGHADILIGDTQFSTPTVVGAGGLWVYSGATGNPIYMVTGTQFGQRLGGYVLLLGDVDGDGHSEFATRDFTPGTHTVFSGATGQPMASWVAWTFGVAADSGDVNGDGAPDLVLGGEAPQPGAFNQAEVRVISVAAVPAATVTFLGPGCGTSGSPTLGLSAPPVLGAGITLQIANAPPSSIGFLLGSAPPASPVLVSPGCLAALDPATLFQVVGFSTDPTGMFQLPLTLAPGAVYSGITLNLQAALLSSSTLLGLTNPLQVTLGY